MNPFIKTLLLSASLLLPLHALADSIGQVVLIQGNPLVERADKHLFLKRKDKLFTGDRIITPIGSKILFRLNDQSTVSLAENTQFELTRYNYDTKSDKSDISFSMLKGAFRTITGNIGKQKEPKFEIHTPVATIGVRGTDFWGGFIFSKALDVTMLSGKGVYVTNDSGAIELTRSGQGTMVSKNAAPSEISIWPETKLDAAVQATELSSDRTTHPSSQGPGSY